MAAVRDTVWSSKIGEGAFGVDGDSDAAESPPAPPPCRCTAKGRTLTVVPAIDEASDPQRFAVRFRGERGEPLDGLDCDYRFEIDPLAALPVVFWYEQAPRAAERRRWSAAAQQVFGPDRPFLFLPAGARGVTVEADAPHYARRYRLEALPTQRFTLRGEGAYAGQPYAADLILIHPWGAWPLVCLRESVDHMLPTTTGLARHQALYRLVLRALDRLPIHIPHKRTIRVIDTSFHLGRVVRDHRQNAR